MKEWFETVFSAMKAWQAGTLLCLSITGNIYLSLWLRDEIKEGKDYLKIVIHTKNEAILRKDDDIERVEQENRELKRKVRELTPDGSAD